MDYNEKIDALASFCDRYEEDLNAATSGALVAFKELDDAFTELSIGWDTTSKYIDNRAKSAREHIVNAMLHIAEQYAEESRIIDNMLNMAPMNQK